MESHLTSLRGSVWSHFLISLFNCLNILENKLVRIKIICPGWWIQKHTMKSIPRLTENMFLFHTGLLLLEYLHSYHSTKKLTIFSSTPTKLWEIHTLNVKTQTIFSLTSFSRAPMALLIYHPSTSLIFILMQKVVWQSRELPSGNQSNLPSFNYICSSVQLTCHHRYQGRRRGSTLQVVPLRSSSVSVSVSWDGMMCTAEVFAESTFLSTSSLHGQKFF